MIKSNLLSKKQKVGTYVHTYLNYLFKIFISLILNPKKTQMISKIKILFKRYINFRRFINIKFTFTICQSQITDEKKLEFKLFDNKSIKKNV